MGTEQARAANGNAELPDDGTLVTVEPSLDLVRTARARLPTRFGTFDVVAFRCDPDGEEHVAVVKGDVEGASAVLARIHSKCLTGDVLHSLRCDCGAQLEHALRAIEAEGAGVLVYLDQEGRGIGLVNKIRAYVLQDGGADTVEANEELGFPADARDYDCAARILRSLGVQSVRLLTNNPEKVRDLQAAGVPVAERVPIHVGENDTNRGYMATKRDVLGHLL